MTSLGDTSIVCDICYSSYHHTHVSLGLPGSIINTIKEYGGRDIKFYCNVCRLEGESGIKGHSLAELLMVVEV